MALLFFTDELIMFSLLRIIMAVHLIGITLLLPHALARPSVDTVTTLSATSTPSPTVTTVLEGDTAIANQFIEGLNLTDFTVPQRRYVTDVKSVTTQTNSSRVGRTLNGYELSNNFIVNGFLKTSITDLQRNHFSSLVSDSMIPATSNASKQSKTLVENTENAEEKRIDLHTHKLSSSKDHFFETKPNRYYEYDLETKPSRDKIYFNTNGNVHLEKPPSSSFVVHTKPSSTIDFVDVHSGQSSRPSFSGGHHVLHIHENDPSDSGDDVRIHISNSNPTSQDDISFEEESTTERIYFINNQAIQVNTKKKKNKIKRKPNSSKKSTTTTNNPLSYDEVEDDGVKINSNLMGFDECGGPVCGEFGTGVGVTVSTHGGAIPGGGPLPHPGGGGSLPYPGGGGIPFHPTGGGYGLIPGNAPANIPFPHNGAPPYPPPNLVPYPIRPFNQSPNFVCETGYVFNLQTRLCERNQLGQQPVIPASVSIDVKHQNQNGGGNHGSQGVLSGTQLVPTFVYQASPGSSSYDPQNSSFSSVSNNKHKKRKRKKRKKRRPSKIKKPALSEATALTDMFDGDMKTVFKKLLKFFPLVALLSPLTFGFWSFLLSPLLVAMAIGSVLAFMMYPWRTHHSPHNRKLQPSVVIHRHQRPKPQWVAPPRPLRPPWNQIKPRQPAIQFPKIGPIQHIHHIQNNLPLSVHNARLEGVRWSRPKFPLQNKPIGIRNRQDDDVSDSDDQLDKNNRLPIGVRWEDESAVTMGNLTNYINSYRTKVLDPTFT